MTSAANLRAEQLHLLDLAQIYIDLAAHAQASAQEILAASARVDATLALIQEDDLEEDDSGQATGGDWSVVEEPQEREERGAAAAEAGRGPAPDLGGVAGGPAPAGGQEAAADPAGGVPAEVPPKYHPLVVAAAKEFGIVPRALQEGSSDRAFLGRRAVVILGRGRGIADAEIAEALEMRLPVMQDGHRPEHCDRELLENHPFAAAVDRIRKAVG